MTSENIKNETSEVFSDRRATTLYADLRVIHDLLITVTAEVKALTEQLKSHIIEYQDFKESIYQAFPERDFNDHHNYHAERTKAKKQSEEIILEGKKKVVGGILWGGILLIGYGAIEWLKQHLTK
jgi:hypothetical protein